jgi:hypothetical protein
MKEAWKAKQLRIAQHYTKARLLVDRIKNRETVANAEIDLTEEEWVQHNKVSSDKHACVLKERHEEAHENAKQDQLLKQQLSDLTVRLTAELDHNRSVEEKLLAILDYLF